LFGKASDFPGATTVARSERDWWIGGFLDEWLRGGQGGDWWIAGLLDWGTGGLGNWIDGLMDWWLIT
jgi:hypothetical protein